MRRGRRRQAAPDLPPSPPAGPPAVGRRCSLRGMMGDRRAVGGVYAHGGAYAAGSMGEVEGMGQGGAPPPPPKRQRLLTAAQLGRPPQDESHTATPSASSSAAAAFGGQKETYVAYMKRADSAQAEAAIRTVLGEYEERGLNHSRKVYQKVQKQKASADPTQALDVLLYYWDERDGAQYEGWWFGNKLGGSQVWAHCKDNGITPPGAGWKVPWNGYVRPEFALVRKEEKLAKEAKQRLTSLTEEVTQAEIESDQASEQAHRTLEGSEETPARLGEAEALLLPQVATLKELERKVLKAAEALRSGGRPPPAFAAQATETLRALKQLGQRVQAKREVVAAECEQTKNKRQQAETTARTTALEDEDAEKLDAVLPEALEKTNAAEDLAEKAAIALEMVAACGGEDGDPDMVKQALEDTERAARAANTAVGEAQIFLRSQTAKLRNFAPHAKTRGEEELGKLKEQLEEAKRKLQPASAARQEWDSKRQLQELMAEVEAQINLADLDIDRAEESSMLMKDDPSKDALDKAQKALEVAGKNVETAITALEGKVAKAKGAAAEALKALLESKGGALRSRLTTLRASLKDGSSRVTAMGFVKQAAEKLEGVKEELRKLEDANAAAEAVLAGLSDTDIAGRTAWEAKMRAPEAVAAAAQMVTSRAKSFMQMKQVEAKRFAGGAGAEAVKELQELQRQAEAAGKKVAELSTGATRRRRQALVKQAEARVAAAEACVREVTEASSIFATGGGEGGSSASAEGTAAATGVGVGGLPAELSAEAVREAASRAMTKEKKAVEVLGEARKALASRSVEVKKENCPEESKAVLLLQERVTVAQAELAEQRKRYGSAEQRLSARRAAEEAEAKIKQTEEKVSQVVASVDGLAEELPDDAPAEGVAQETSAVKAVEVASREAQLAVRMMLRLLESQSRGQGFVRQALAALEPRAKRVQAELETASERVRRRAEHGFVRSLLQEVRTKAAECDRRLAEAVAAEPPEEGADKDDLVEVGKQVLAFERAIQAAQTAQSGAKTAVSMKRLAAKRLSETAAPAANEALDKLQHDVEASGTKVSGLRARAIDAKAALLQRKGAK